MTRDQLANALRRVHETTLSNADVEVYNASVDFSQGDGYSVTYPESPTAVVTARVESADADGERDRGGTTSEADATIRVPDEPGYGEGGFGEDGFGTIAYTEYGEGEQAPARLRDVSTDTLYEVVDWRSDHNGLLVIDAKEV